MINDDKILVSGQNDVFDVDFWRMEFQQRFQKWAEPRSLRRTLAERGFDFTTDEINNVKHDRASLVVTRNIVTAMDIISAASSGSIIDEPNPRTTSEDLLKRQKIVTGYTPIYPTTQKLKEKMDETSKKS